MAGTNGNNDGRGVRARDAAQQRKAAKAKKAASSKATGATTRSQAGRTNTSGRPAGSGAGKKAATSRNTKAEPVRSQTRDERPALSYEDQVRRTELVDEILVIVTLLLGVILVLSYLHFCGSFGEILNLIVFGLFGGFGYVFPFALVLIEFFCISNKHNRNIIRKAAFCFGMLVFLSALVQMTFGGYNPDIKLGAYFNNSVPGYEGADKTYGGFFGGLIAMLLVPYVGSIAAVCIMIAAVLVFFVLVAGKAVFTSITRKGLERARRSRDDYYEDDYGDEEAEDDRPIEYPPHGPGVNAADARREARRARQAREERVSDFDEEEFLQSVDRGDFDRKAQKGGFIDKLMRQGMGISEKILEDTPEFKEYTEQKALEEGYAGAYTEDLADKAAEADLDFADSELMKKFGSAEDRGQASAMPRSRINEVNDHKTYMVDEEPEADRRGTFDRDNRRQFLEEDRHDYEKAYDYEDTPIRADHDNYESSINHTEKDNKQGGMVYELRTFNKGQSEDEYDDMAEAAESEQAAGDRPNKVVSIWNRKRLSQEAEAEAASEELRRVAEAAEAREAELAAEETKAAEEAREAEERRYAEEAAAEELRQAAQAMKPKQAEESIWADSKDRTSSGAVCFTDMSKAKPIEKVIPPYEFPPIDLLNKPSGPAKSVGRDELDSVVEKLQRTFESFGVGVKVTDATCGPTVTRYELTPEQGVKVKTITSLSDDIKLALAAADIRIEAPIPGKAAVGIEVPNRTTSPVLLRDLLDSAEFKDAPSKLTFAVGKDIGGKTICFDIGSMPHMLIAGATGSGKSVCINTLIMSILYKAKPTEVKMIMIDPKRVELVGYNGIPHLLVPVVTDVKKATGALNWAIAEMDDRYSRFADNSVNNLASYNRLMEERYYEEGNEGECPNRLPQIVIIVDELNDLMMTANGKEVEASIVRLTQLARASGIHVVLATQRPSVNVITGTIKANIPSRIAFSVSSIVDSRTILDQAGAEKLLGKGDMLFYPQGYPKPVRLQGAYVSDKEVSGVVDYVKSKCKEVKYSDAVAKHIEGSAASDKKAEAQQAQEEVQAGDGRDEFYEKAGRLIIEKQKASIGMLQRIYRIGFNRAARIMDQLAEDGVVGPEEGTKPRRIIMTLDDFNRFLNSDQAEGASGTEPEDDGAYEDADTTEDY